MNMREQFEELYKKMYRLKEMPTYVLGDYKVLDHQNAWEIWQAALAAQAQIHQELGSAKQAYEKAYAPHNDSTWFPFGDGYKAGLKAARAQKEPVKDVSLSSFIQKHTHKDGEDAWNYNSLATSAQDFIDSAIDAFEARSQKETETKWISVDDALPESFSYVDVYIKSKENNTYGTRKTSVLFVKGVFKLNQFFEYEYVSHWMPLPPAPEGEKNAK